MKISPRRCIVASGEVGLTIEPGAGAVMSTVGGILRAWHRRRAVAAYLRRLPGQLRRDYGPADRYTPAQIRASVRRARLDETHSCYAVALYSEPGAFAADHAARGAICDYEAMRAEVSAVHFGGRTIHTPGEALSASEAAHPGREGSGHHGPAMDHGGSHGGGHGGSDGGHGGW